MSFSPPEAKHRVPHRLELACEDDEVSMMTADGLGVTKDPVLMTFGAMLVSAGETERIDVLVSRHCPSASTQTTSPKRLPPCVPE